MKLFGLILFLLFFGLPIGIFALILLKGIKHTRADEWEGKVVDKFYQNRTSYRKVGTIGKSKKQVSTFYTVVFKTNKGERKISVTSEDFEKWKVGDRARKMKGKLQVERV